MGKVVKAVAGIALAVGVAVAAAPTGGLSVALAGALGVSATVASAIAAVGLSFAAGLVMKALASAPRAQAQPLNFKQSISNSFIIIGKRRQGGLLAFFHPWKEGGDHYRAFIWASAGHRCKGALRWWLNDEVVSVDAGGMVTSGPYAGAAWLWFGRGQSDVDEAPPGWRDGSVGTKWTVDHKLLGVAKIYAKFRMSEEVVQAGMPTMSAEIEGADEIADPRSGIAGYTRNATLAFYWWLGLPREEGGFGAPADEMPADALLAAWANVCDEDVPLASGGTEKRYEFDALIETGAAPSEIRSTFVTCCAGSYTYSEGQHLMRPGYWVPPELTLEEGDLAGEIGIPLLSRAEEYATEVTGTFIDPQQNYQPQPVPTRSVPSADIRQMNVDLPHITSHTRGQRILEIMLRRAAAEKRVSWPMNIAGLKTRAMQTVQLGTARYGLSNYAWTIDGWALSSDFSIDLGLREENAEIYEWSAADEKAAPSVAAPDKPEPIPPPVPEMATSAAQVTDGTTTYTPEQIRIIEDRVAALESPPA